jgi:DNA (cytosine-5)-methyltransferase 1
LADAAGQERPGLPSRAQAKHAEFRSPGDHGAGPNMADADGSPCEGDRRAERVESEHAIIDSAGAALADADGNREKRNQSQNRQGSGSKQSGWWRFEPDVGRVAHGVAARVDRLRALGNGQVPAVAAAAWRRLNQPEKETKR